MDTSSFLQKAAVQSVATSPDTQTRTCGLLSQGPCNLPEFPEEDWLRAGNRVTLPQKEGREKAQNHLTQYVTHSSVLVKSELLIYTHAHLQLEKQ